MAADGIPNHDTVKHRVSKASILLVHDEIRFSGGAGFGGVLSRHEIQRQVAGYWDQRLGLKEGAQLGQGA
jgi:hypothetical protein